VAALPFSREDLSWVDRLAASPQFYSAQALHNEHASVKPAGFSA
jgi:hypothetical protein